MTTRTRPAPRRLLARTTAAMLAASVLVAGACSRNDGSGGAATTGTVAVDGNYINATTSDERPVSGGSLVYGISADTNSWNPTVAQWASYSMLEARTMFEFLTEFDEEGNAKPYVAESLTPNADFTEWTVKLRDGIKWSNGTDLTAKHVADAQNFVRKSLVVGGGVRLIKPDGFTIVDRLTFKVAMEKPYSSYPMAMASQLGAIAHPDWLANVDDWQHPLGTGPYAIDQWNLDRNMIVKRNPHYWRKDSFGTQLPYLDRIEFKVIPDERERAAALRTGDVDIMLQTLASDDVASLREEARQGMFQSFSDDEFESAEDHIVLNTKKPPFDDVDARRALAYATDQQAYIQALTGGLNKPADGAVAPNSKWYERTGYPEYDPSAARELVEKVKARSKTGTFEFELVAQDTPEASRMQQWLVTAWAQVGITAKPTTVANQKKIIGMVTGGNQATISQLYDSPAPINDSVFWPGTNDELVVKGDTQFSLAFARLHDPQLQALFERFNTSADPTVQHDTQAEIQRRLAELTPFVWLGHASRTVVASNNLVNIVDHTLPDGSKGADFVQGSHTLYQVWRKV